MYEKIYNTEGELISIKIGNSYIPLDEKNRHYKKYLKDIAEGVDVIDNPPTASDIEIQKALDELVSTDAKIPRELEDIYDVLTETQRADLAQQTRDAIIVKKSKRLEYLALL